MIFDRPVREHATGKPTAGDDPPPSLPAKGMLLLALSVFAALAATSGLIVGRPSLLAGRASYLVDAVASLATTMLAVRVSQPMVPRYRRSWRLIAAAVALGGALQAVAGISTGCDAAVWGVLGKALPATAGVLGLLGLLGLSDRHGSKTRSLTLALEGIVIGLAALTIMWLVFQPEDQGSARPGSPLLTTLAGTTLIALVLLRLGQVPRSWFGPVAMLGVAGGLTLPSVLLPSPPVARGLTAALWVSGCAAVAISTLGGTWRLEASRVEPLLVQRFLPYLAAIAAGLAVALSRLAGHPVPPPVPALILAIAISLAVRQLIGVLDDQQHVDQLLHQATHDPLTGLYNRSVLNLRLDMLLQRLPDAGRTNALLFIDLDEFKFVNDGISHAVGDTVIQSVASRLRLAVRPTDMVVRLGGDEFAILLENRRLEDVRSICERLRKSVHEPHQVPGHDLRVSCSIGVAVAEEGESPASLLRKADAAMYAAKRVGKDEWRFFDSDMQAESEFSLHLLQDLQGALDHGHLQLAFQPITNLASGLFFGAEVLLRWLRPGEGWVSIGSAMDALEGTTLMATIDAWVLREACKQLRRWREAGWQARLGINISVAELSDPTYPIEFARVLREEGVEPPWLGLEVTERMALSASRSAHQNLQSLRAIGVRVSIDDFGTAYSSMLRLREFGFDSLKIDASFVNDNSDKGRKLLRGMVAIGEAIGVAVIAEGVETAEQAALLLSYGCRLGQGFHICAPVTADELERKFIDTGTEVPRPPVVEAALRAQPVLLAP